MLIMPVDEEIRNLSLLQKRLPRQRMFVCSTFVESLMDSWAST